MARGYRLDLSEMNPLNPLNWIKSTQDWFQSTELSSGFRPYLIFLILCEGGAICLLTFFSRMEIIVNVAVALLLVPVGAFILLFGIKSFQDPRFCRSEKHVEKVIKMELETMGSESVQISAADLEIKSLTESMPEPKALKEP